MSATHQQRLGNNLHGLSAMIVISMHHNRGQLRFRLERTGATSTVITDSDPTSKQRFLREFRKHIDVLT